jgi:hypothetical protein
LFGHNYFNRYSSPEVESWEEAEERAHILVDAASLKQLAIDYLHPEIGVNVWSQLLQSPLCTRD